MKYGDMVLLKKGDPYHEWYLSEHASNLKAKIVRVKYQKGALRKYRYRRLLDDGILLVIDGIQPTKEVRKEIEEINSRQRVVVLIYDNKEQLNFGKKCKFNNKPPIVKLPVDDWDDKYEECVKMLDRFGLHDFESADVRKQLVKLMIRQPELWRDVRLSAEIIRKTRGKVTVNFITDIFDDVDFYRLDDWILEVLEGVTKRKTLKIAHYFIEVKEYNPVWLMQKIREAVLDIGVVYSAYKRGVIFDGSESKSTIANRSTAVDFEFAERLVELGTKRVRWCRHAIDKLDMRYFVRLESVIFTGGAIVDKEWDLFRYIEEIRNCRTEFSEEIEEVREYKPRKRK